MPAKDIYHDVVVHALTAEGWRITDDPLSLSFGGKDLFVDLGAERDTIAAEKSGQKIAVEIKSFLSPSIMRDLEGAYVGREPLRCEGLHRIDDQRPLRAVLRRLVRCAQQLERFADGRRQLAARLGKRDLARTTQEERRANPVFQHLDLVADGGLRHSELIAGPGEAAMARRRLKDPKRVQRKLARHLHG